MCPDVVCALIRVYGRVQGVGYRAFTQSLAEKLSIKGYVRNMSDGSVEILAEGSRDSMERFIKELERGPFLATVEKIDVTWDKPTGKYEGFEIIY